MVLTYKRPSKKDLPETIKLLFKFRDDYSELFPTPDVDKVTATVQHHYEKGFIHNVYKDNKLIGSIGAAPSEWWFSPEKFISETWFNNMGTIWRYN